MAIGIFNTSMLTADLAKKSFAAAYMRYMPNGNAPLFGLTSMLKSETALSFEHGFFSKTMVFPEMKTNGGLLLAASTTLTFDTTANLLPGMIMRNERTGENIIINAVPTATTITCSRAIGTVAAAAILDNDDWYQVGTAFEESSLRPAASNIVPVRVTNLTQIFRNTWAISGTSGAVQVIAGGSTDAEVDVYDLLCTQDLRFSVGTSGAPPDYPTMEQILDELAADDKTFGGSLSVLGVNPFNVASWARRFKVLKKIKHFLTPGAFFTHQVRTSKDVMMNCDSIIPQEDNSLGVGQMPAMMMKKNLTRVTLFVHRGEPQSNGAGGFEIGPSTLVVAKVTSTHGSIIDPTQKDLVNT